MKAIQKELFIIHSLDTASKTNNSRLYFSVASELNRDKPEPAIDFQKWFS